MSFLKSLPLLIWDHRGNIFAALLILAGVAIAIGAVLAMIGFAVTVGLPLAAGILIVLVSFFAIAWLPFAVVIFFFGLFSYRRSILTHRTRNALILTCIAIFIGDLFSVELRDSLLFQVVNLPESVYAGYAAVLVMLSALLYTRFVYLDGVTRLADYPLSNKRARPFLNILTFPSFAILALVFDLFVPLAFTAVIVDRHGCDGLELVSRLATDLDNDYKISDRWHLMESAVYDSDTFRQSRVLFDHLEQLAYDNLPVLKTIENSIAERDLTLVEFRVCQQQA